MLRRHAAKPLPRTVRKSVSMERCSSIEDGWWPLGAPALPLAEFALPLAPLALPLDALPLAPLGLPLADFAWPLAESDTDSWPSAKEFAAPGSVAWSNGPLNAVFRPACQSDAEYRQERTAAVHRFADADPRCRSR